MQVGELSFANPLAIVSDSFERSQIAPGKNVLRSDDYFSFFKLLDVSPSIDVLHFLLFQGRLCFSLKF